MLLSLSNNNLQSNISNMLKIESVIASFTWFVIFKVSAFENVDKKLTKSDFY